VLVRQRHLDVDGGEDGKDIGLEGTNEDLENDERDAKSERAYAQKPQGISVGKHRKEEEVCRKEAQVAR
jgi:hypothetical protein